MLHDMPSVGFCPFLVSLSLFHMGGSWNHIPNKLLALESLSQGLQRGIQPEAEITGSF